ncbi:MAG: oxidoreductase [Actinobacteria bacterium]|nr:oxidoreductase [Actinomycetota bacterium]
MSDGHGVPTTPRIGPGGDDVSLDLVVTAAEPVAKGVVRLTLSQRDGGQLPPWTPGAHIDLHFTSGGVTRVRQYSLCGDIADRRQWQVAVLLVAAGRGGSAHIHETFAEGRSVRVTGPRNNFPLVAAPSYLFVAGGIGITPILPMIAWAESTGTPWRLVYCGRSADSMAYLDEVAALGADRVRIQPSDTMGRADLGTLIGQADSTTAVYCCGPESMVGEVERAGETRPSGMVHVERFARREGMVDRADTAFEVEFAKSGVLVTVPADRSILEVAEDAGIDIDSSCQEGVCGTCETAVLSGVPDHRDDVLSPGERGACTTIIVCVSRSCSARLVLDA